VSFAAQCEVSANGGAHPCNAAVSSLIGRMWFAALPPKGVLGLDLGDHVQSRGRSHVAGDAAVAANRGMCKRQESISSHLLLQVAGRSGVMGAFGSARGPGS
jgi:hypothetical protein